MTYKELKIGDTFQIVGHHLQSWNKCVLRKEIFTFQGIKQGARIMSREKDCFISPNCYSFSMYWFADDDINVILLSSRSDL